MPDNRNRKITFLLLALCFFVRILIAQDSIQKQNQTEYTVSAFFDVYYVYDSGRPGGGFRQLFLFNHNRHNEASLNLGYIKASALNSKYRANAALMAGTYTADNYSQEPEIFKRIFELNAGFSLNAEKNIWLDAGIYSSHIGFEGAVSSENFTLTRSLLAENSPYYLAGTKLTYEPGKRWSMSLLICNGWQRIRPLSGNSLPSFGTQIRHQRKKFIYNWSTLTGTDDPDTSRRIRCLNNFYVQSAFEKGFDFIAGFDIGIQQKRKLSHEYSNWYGTVLILRYQFSESWATALRAENYEDKDGVIVNYIPSFNSASFSLNLDFQPSKNVLCRIEGRLFYSEEKVFRAGNTFTDNSKVIAASVAVYL